MTKHYSSFGQYWPYLRRAWTRDCKGSTKHKQEPVLENIERTHTRSWGTMPHLAMTNTNTNTCTKTKHEQKPWKCTYDDTRLNNVERQQWFSSRRFRQRHVQIKFQWVIASPINQTSREAKEKQEMTDGQRKWCLIISWGPIFLDKENGKFWCMSLLY